MEEVLKAYPKDVKVVFMQYPLPFHDKAEGAAVAALAAHQQGKFWEMHDLLFTNQQTLGDGRNAALPANDWYQSDTRTS